LLLKNTINRGRAFWAYPDAHASGSKILFSSIYELNDWSALSYLEKNASRNRNAASKDCMPEDASNEI
jgi:hypothetical protein